MIALSFSPAVQIPWKTLPNPRDSALTPAARITDNPSNACSSISRGSGLDTDYLGRPFHPMPELLAVADEITKTLAICMQCGNPAKHTQRLIASEDLIVVGAEGMYEARCRRCFEPNLASTEVKKKKAELEGAAAK